MIAQLQQHDSWSRLGATELRVLLALVKHTNVTKPKGSARPSRASIAAQTGNSPRSVTRALATLKRLGFIKLESRGRTKDPHRRGVGRYTVLLPNVNAEPNDPEPASTGVDRSVS